MSIRCFIAVELDAGVRRELGVLQDRLSGRLAGDDKAIKWVRPELIHLTIKFLGDVEDSRIDGVCRAAAAAASEVEPFEFGIADVGCFPPDRPARVVWAGVTDQTQMLGALHQAIDANLTEIGFAPDGRKFSPHLTLARIKNAKLGRQVQDLIVALKPVTLQGQAVDTITVMTSELSRTGPAYTPLHHARLGK